jgi:hypothetical protein
MHLRNVILAALALAAVALAQNPITVDSPFQVRYAANLTAGGEAYINISNSGANGAPPLGPGFGSPAGNLCINAYAFDSNENMVSCCSCLVTPNGLLTLGVKRDILSNTLTGLTVDPATVKLLATLAGGTGTGTSCFNSAAAVTAATRGATGMLAWGTSLEPQAGGFNVVETPFTPASLGAGEAASLGGRCASIIGNGSGSGQCPACPGDPSCTLTATAPNLSFLPLGTLVNIPIPISGGTAPYTCTLSSGQLPAGLSINNCSIVGGTTQNTSFSYTISVRDSGHCSAQVTGSGSGGCGFSNVSATCPQISARRGPVTVGTIINPVTVSVTGGVAPFTCSATGLPSGLSMSSSCTIFGASNVPGTFPYTISVKDTCNATGSVACSVTIQ